jgi:5-methylcytosine-specific restriction endonuclease McrA
VTLIEGTQIRIPSERRKARHIIKLMDSLLEARHRLTISRRVFLTRWSSLRKALFLTPDYQELRREVLQRNNGKCELCGEAPTVHMHHLIGVSMNPHLALRKENVKGTCRPCHKAEH